MGADEWPVLARRMTRASACEPSSKRFLRSLDHFSTSREYILRSAPVKSKSAREIDPLSRVRPGSGDAKPPLFSSDNVPKNSKVLSGVMRNRPSEIPPITPTISPPTSPAWIILRWSSLTCPRGSITPRTITTNYRLGISTCPTTSSDTPGIQPWNIPAPLVSVTYVCLQPDLAGSGASRTCSIRWPPGLCLCSSRRAFG